jgi:hypothetical protein
MNKRMTRQAVVVCAGVAALAGCMTPRDGEPGGGMRSDRQPRYNDQECTPNGLECKIDVRIDCHSLPCVGVVDPKVLLVIPETISPGTHPRTIRWKLTGTSHDYEFKDEKVITGESAFDCTSPGQHQKQVTCKDTFAGTKKTFEYTLQIINTSNGSVLTIDPWIVNR